MNFQYEGIDGSFWRLAGDHEGRDGVLIEEGGISGLVAEVEVHTEPGAASTGVLVVGMDVAPMTGGLSYTIGPDFIPPAENVGTDAVHVDALARRWRRAWSLNPARYGTLTAHSPGGAALTTPVRATSMTVPDTSPDSPAAHWQYGEVSLVSDLGIWLAVRERVLAGVLWTNPGELPVWPTVEWSGSGSALTAPGLSSPLVLPPSAHRVVLDTDPATGCVVRRVDTGEVVQSVWRAMRGRRAPLAIGVGQTTEGWSISGSNASIHVQARVLDPWAW